MNDKEKTYSVDFSAEGIWSYIEAGTKAAKILHDLEAAINSKDKKGGFCVDDLEVPLSAIIALSQRIREGIEDIGIENLPDRSLNTVN